MNTIWPWLVLIALGAYHGLNPGMGWLFAVSRGLQERSRGAVLASLGPIALGHMASVAVVVALVALAQPFVETTALRMAGAVALLGFGVYKLVAQAHPRWVGMRVGLRDLALWSFLMATAHGAGLMLVPVLLQAPVEAAHAAHLPAAAIAAPADHSHEEHAHMGHAAAAQPSPAERQAAGLAAVAVHTVAMFAAMAAVAVLVYEKLGLAVLRRAWGNPHLLWAFSLIVARALSWPRPRG
ncbi:MAG TPA: hypothetical protein PKD53_08915 [Chloroflexaceae bacterium]|nr:hypothetical protein [Chloroflexaceae bacterium]